MSDLEPYNAARRVLPPSSHMAWAVAILTSAAIAVVCSRRGWKLASRGGRPRTSPARKVSCHARTLHRLPHAGILLRKARYEPLSRQVRGWLQIPELGCFTRAQPDTDAETAWDGGVPTISSGRSRPGTRPRRGRMLAPIMPWHAFAELTEQDAQAIAAISEEPAGGSERGARTIRSNRDADLIRVQGHRAVAGQRRISSSGGSYKQKGPAFGRALRIFSEREDLHHARPCRPFHPCRRRPASPARLPSAIRRPSPRW